MSVRKLSDEELLEKKKQLLRREKRCFLIDLAIFIALVLSTPNVSVTNILFFGGNTTLPALVLIAFAAYSLYVAYSSLRMMAVNWLLRKRAAAAWSIISVLLALSFTAWLLLQAVH